MRASFRLLPLLALLACATPGRPPEPDRTRVPVPGPPAPLRVPPEERFELPGGLRVRLVEYHRLPIVALQLVVDAGAVRDPPGRPGLASFTASMLAEGTTGRSATRVSDDLAAIGASLSASAGFDAAQLSVAALSRHLDPLLELFAEALRHPAFADEDVARLRDQRLVALRQQRDQPGLTAQRTLSRAFWGPDHPYGHVLLGTEESLRALDGAALREFHRRTWRPGAAELVVVGDLRRADLEPRLARALAGWTGAGEPPVPAPPQPRPASRVVLVEKAGAPQTQLLLGLPGLARAGPGKAAADVAFQILGGGTASRFFRHLREEQGWTYGIAAAAEARKLGGNAVVVGSVKTEHTGDALRAILAELEDLRQRPVSPEELRTAADGIVRGLPGEFSTAAGIAAKLADAVVHGLPDGYWPAYADEVRRVGAEEVRQAARAWLDLERVTAVLVGDAAAVRPQLEGLPLGPLEIVAEPR